MRRRDVAGEGEVITVCLTSEELFIPDNYLTVRTLEIFKI